MQVIVKSLWSAGVIITIKFSEWRVTYTDIYIIKCKTKPVNRPAEPENVAFDI